MLQRLSGWWPAASLAALGAAVYANGLRGVFILDDLRSVENPAIHHLRPIGPVLAGPRPVVELSLAVNYALGGRDVIGYHIFNVAVHLLAALTLFGIVRRTLQTERLRDRFGAHATALAWVTAAIWMVHPLQTESVTYVIQRAESLMGLFYLLTIYCAIRAAGMRNAECRVTDDQGPKTKDRGPRQAYSGPAEMLALSVIGRRSSVVMSALCILFCALGMATKPVMVTAPIMVAAYDWAFISRSARRMIERSWPLYLGLGLTWAAPAFLLWRNPAGETAGFGMPGQAPWEYARTQFGVIVHYLRLSFWPHPLCLDYGWPIAQTARDIVPAALLVGALAAATVHGLFRAPAAGFLGLWFFLILAPTSSIMPIKDPCFEHRMYLSLAAVVALAVVGGYVALKWALARSERPGLKSGPRTGWTPPVCMGLAFAVCATLGTLTVLRNQDYTSDVRMWGQVVRLRPQNVRAWYNLGTALLDKDRNAEAASALEQAVKLNPAYAEARTNLGIALMRQGQLKEAMVQLNEALRVKPDYATARVNLGLALAETRKYDEAIRHYREAIRLTPDSATALTNLAWVRATARDPKARDATEAADLARRAAALAGPSRHRALDALAAAHARAGRYDQATATAQEALRAASAAGDEALKAGIEVRLKLYQDRKAYTE